MTDKTQTAEQPSGRLDMLVSMLKKYADDLYDNCGNVHPDDGCEYDYGYQSGCEKAACEILEIIADFE